MPVPWTEEQDKCHKKCKKLWCEYFLMVDYDAKNNHVHQL